MPEDTRIRELAVKYDTCFDTIWSRINELLECLEDCNSLDAGLSICMALEVYGIFPAGIHPKAPSYQEYQDFLNDLIEHVVLHPDVNTGNN
jgi:hypothetical protein